MADEVGDMMTVLPASPTPLTLVDVLARKRTPKERAVALAKAGIIAKSEIKQIEIRLGRKKRR